MTIPICYSTVVFLAFCTIYAAASHPPINVTALASRNGFSVIECWSLFSVPVEAFSAVNYGLGNTTKATWSVIEPRTTVGEAWAPAAQLTIILNGLIRIIAPSPISTSDMSGSTLLETYDSLDPPASTVAYIVPGTLKSSMVIAADTKSTSYLKGHYTDFASNEPTILIQVQFEGNHPPEHQILNSGPCT